MTLETLIAFNLVLLAALASPGAALLFAIKTSAASGRTAGIATGVGLGAMAAMWTLAALLGLEGVFAIFPWAYTALKIGGALYLLWLAVQTWCHAHDPLGDSERPTGRAILSGLLINAGNPKSVLFAAAVIVLVFPQGLGAGEIAWIMANHFLLEVCFYSLVAVFLSSPPAKRGYLRAKPMLDRIAATLLGGLGLRLLTER